MDTSESNRVSNTAATRKRRSSILKSQRPTRKPFSEIELSVATPTDTAKSRRVSFSRRTGVAEFATNEATTTWKNVYEEHNKSLELSSNESQANAQRQPISHIGKRIFDQQFQDVDTEIDFVDTDHPQRTRNRDSSLNINISQQLAALEATVDSKLLTAPKANFELSSFTDNQTKLFCDDLSNPTMVIDHTGQVPIEDDLDEIQQDLKQAHPSIIGPGQYRKRREVSEYIEVDLNMTHVPVQNEESDMSITDTIVSPKVNIVNVPKTNISHESERKSTVTPNWEADKENIVLNPYIAPSETDNFALNEESNKVLVFDGKRLTLQSESVDVQTDASYTKKKHQSRKSIVPKRRTIIMNVNDDLPNFVDDINASNTQAHGRKEISIADLKKNMIFDEDDVSITQVVTNNVTVNSDHKNTQVFSDDLDNISVTQALPSNILTHKKRQTIIYENDTGNISMTQALPANIIVKSKLQETHNVTLYDRNDISLTQAVPNNIDLKDIVEARNNDTGNISMTQALPSNIIINKKRCTIVFDDNAGDISVTQALPPNIILQNVSALVRNTEQEPNSDTVENISVKKGAYEKIKNRYTMLYDNETGDISMTQALPVNIISNCLTDGVSKSHDVNEPNLNVEQLNRDVNDADEYNISVTQALPTNILANNKRRTIIYDSGTGDISMTQTIPANVLIESIKTTEIKATSSVIPTGEKETLLSQDIPNDELLNQTNSNYISKNTLLVAGNLIKDINYTIMNEDNSCVMSLTKSMPQNIIVEGKEDTDLKNDEKESNIEVFKSKRKTTTFLDESGNNSLSRPIPTNIVHEVYHVHEQQTEKPQHQTKDTESNHSSVDITLPSNDVEEQSGTVQPAKEKSIMDDLLDMDNSSNHKIVEKLDVAEVSGDANYFAACQTAITCNEDTQDLENQPIAVLENKDSYAKEPVLKIDQSHLNAKQSLIKNISPKKSYTEVNMDTNDYYIKEVTNVKDSDAKDTIVELDQSNLYIKQSPVQNILQEKNSKEIKMDTSDDNIEDVTNKTTENLKEADDTKELLEMSHYTDKTINKHDKTTDNHMKSRMSLGNLNESIQPRRLSFASKRLSTVLSREDMLDSILMAQTMLQQTALMDDLEETEDHSVHNEENKHQVVKMLTFEDDGDDVDEEEFKQEMKSPLKKQAFADGSVVKDKTKVIPSYLKDVSDGMKELMLDLVKPMVDVSHFETSRPNTDLKQSISTCSQQIQANLVTSSQVDLDVDSDNDSSSSRSNDKRKVASKVKGNVTFEDCVSDTDILPKYEEPSNQNHTSMSQRKARETVIQFDQKNPLNNILIMPQTMNEPHEYSRKSSIKDNNEGQVEINENASEAGTDNSKIVKSQTDTQSLYSCVSVPQNYQDPITDDLVSDTNNTTQPETKATNFVPLTETSPLVATKDTTRVIEVKDQQENTVIAMVDNKELLATTSLGLIVDSAAFEISAKVPSKTIDTAVDSHTNPKKRSLSITPNKGMVLKSETTPKPILKMPKISKSPVLHKATEIDNKMISSSEHEEQFTKGTVVTVARCLTEFGFSKLGRDKEKSDSSGKSDGSTDCVSSHSTSIKKSSVTVKDSWEMDEEECVPNVSTSNVVATINQLPFMGTEEVEWEGWSGDAWRFRLLCGRLRLCVRLAHRVDNALRTHVAPDTPVCSMQLHATPHESESALVVLCVRYAAAAMSAVVEGGASRASHVPCALRRLAAVARRAARWARLLHHAKLRLALHVRDGEPLLLKVANFHLRSVWDVTVCIEVGRDASRRECWPRACDVTVTTVAGEDVHAERLQNLVAAVPDDWGHVPRTVWRIFKYLKNLKREDDMLMAMRLPIHNKQH